MKPVCEAWYRVAPNVLEELNHSMPRKITDLIQAEGDTKNTDFMMLTYNVVVFSLEGI